MSDESVDFDTLFPNFDPSRFEDEYPSEADFPKPFWEIALRRV